MILAFAAAETASTCRPSPDRHQSVPLIVIPRQLGRRDLGIWTRWRQAIDDAEFIESVHARRQPMIPVSTLYRAIRAARRRCS
jgi:hypothetical protein